MKHFALIVICLAAASAAPAATVEPSSTKASRNLIVRGNEQFNDSNFHAALEYYEQSLALDPASVYAKYNKAATLVQLASDDNKGTQNDPRAAAAELFKEIAGNKAYPRLAAYSAYNLGNMAFNDGNYDGAIAAYKQSLRLIPDNVKARQNLLLALQKKEEQEQQQDQQQDQQQQEEEQQQQQQQQQEQQQQPPQPTQSAQQMMQAVQNKENNTRRQQVPAGGSPYTEKPW